MKIDKIEIAGFGKFNNFTLDFDSGLNIIVGENESGKSTVCDFLLSMLYDVPNDLKRASFSENIRQKYKPWKSETFGGRMFFTDDNGKKYILEKTFGKTSRSDRSKLLDAESWEECGNAENIGERLFGLSREGFLKTLYVKALGIDSMQGGGEEVISKLSNMETSGDEDISYDNVKNALEKEMFSILSKTGRGGKIAVLQEEERNLSLELSRLEHKSSALKEDEERMLKLKEDIEELNKKITELEKKHETALRHEQFVARQKTYETKNIIKKRLDAEKERLRQLCENRENSAPDNSVTLMSELSQKETEYENIKSPISKGVSILSAILSFIVFVVLGVVIKNVLLFGVLGAVISAVLLAGTHYLNKKNETKRENLDYEIAEIRKKIDEEEKRKDNESVIEETQKTIEELNESLSSFDTEEDTIFTQEEIEYQGEQSSEITYKIREYKVRLKSLSDEHYSLSIALAKQSGDERSVSDINSELLAVKEEIKKCEKELLAYQKASEWLNKAYEEIKKNFAPALNKKIEEVFSKLTNGKYDGVRLGEDLNLNYKNEYDEIVESGHLSQGANDLLYISLRIASMSLLCDKIPPVILDDAFIQLDDTRLKLVIDYIKENEKFSQVIMFTCHKKTAELFENVKIIEIS